MWCNVRSRRTMDIMDMNTNPLHSLQNTLLHDRWLQQHTPPVFHCVLHIQFKYFDRHAQVIVTKCSQEDDGANEGES